MYNQGDWVQIYKPKTLAIRNAGCCDLSSGRQESVQVGRGLIEAGPKRKWVLEVRGGSKGGGALVAPTVGKNTFTTNTPTTSSTA
jgi:hypothetical protein